MCEDEKENKNVYFFSNNNARKEWVNIIVNKLIPDNIT